MGHPVVVEGYRILEVNLQVASGGIESKAAPWAISLGYNDEEKDYTYVATIIYFNLTLTDVFL